MFSIKIKVEDDMEMSGIMAFGGNWGGFKYLTVHYDALSDTGRILLCGFFALALIASVCSPWWMRALARRSANKKVGDIEWIAVPNAGYYLPFLLFFLLMPICGFFSNRDDTWWILLIFGWLVAVLILVFVHELKIRLAIIKDARDEYWLTRWFGLWGWRVASSLPGLTADKAKFIGYNSYYLYYDKNGSMKKYAYLSDAHFPSSCLPHLVEFIREYKIED